VQEIAEYLGTLIGHTVYIGVIGIEIAILLYLCSRAVTYGRLRAIHSFKKRRRRRGKVQQKEEGKAAG
jgi:hypothetical protein